MQCNTLFLSFAGYLAFWGMHLSQPLHCVSLYEKHKTKYLKVSTGLLCVSNYGLLDMKIINHFKVKVTYLTEVSFRLPSKLISV